MGLAVQFPVPIGEDEDFHSLEQRAILGALEPALDPNSGTENWCEAYGEATVLASAWACTRRAANQAIPTRMIEALPGWETCCGLRPVLEDSDYERRQRLAAHNRALVGNSYGDLEDVAARALGANFEELRVVDPADHTVYWPGINPGPPSLEWSTNRCRYGVVLNTNALSTNASYDAKRDAVAVAFERSLPAWAAYCVGVGSSFVVGIGVVGKTYL
jgi:hypothetical protein